MVFNSADYILLLAGVVALYGLLRTARQQNLLLLAASYVFYASWDWRFLALLLLTTGVNYLLAGALHGTDSAKAPRRRRWLLVAALGFNLGLLGFFKYFNFFILSFSKLLETLGFSAHLPTLNILLPVGISFFTFQVLSYVLDVYRGDAQPERSLLNFALYVGFFPQLLAGPIERAPAMLPQYAAPRRLTAGDFEQGVALILLGLFKKIVIADVAATVISHEVFNAPLDYAPGQVLAAVYLFAVQLYADFSGYSDIARGSARLLGIRLMVNFNQPYFAQTITEFWNRWHISLSLWLRIYIFLPLSRTLLKRTGKGDLAFNSAIMVTMLASGLWHGANLTFVLWGGLHGLYQIIGRPLRSTARPLLRHPSVLVRRTTVLARVLLAFHLVLLAWVLFAVMAAVPTPAASAQLLAESALQRAGEVYAQMAAALTGGFGADLLALAAPVLLLYAVLFAVDAAQLATGEHTFLLRLPRMAQAGLVLLTLLSLIFFAVKPYVPFFYFQF